MATGYFHDKKEVVQLLHDEFGVPLEKMHLAASHGSIGVIEYLLELKFDCNERIRGQTPLHAACSSGDFYKVVRLLLLHGANPGERSGLKGRTPLHEACAIGAVSSIAELVMQMRPRDSNSFDMQGRTPLLLAIAEERTGSISALSLHEEIDFELPSRLDGNRPLFSAIARRKSLSTVASLLSAGCDVNSRSHGLTPLFLSATMGSHGYPYAHLLLQCPDVDVNAQCTSEKMTPLIQACMTRCAKTIRALGRRKDLNVDLTNYWGDTAMTVAIGMKDSSVIDELLGISCV
jgi:ankyrin repeat protein